MNRKKLLFAGLLLFAAGGCHHKDRSQGSVQAGGRGAADSSAARSADSTRSNYFPVADYLRGEIRVIDSTPAALVRYDIRPRRTDSSFISVPMFNRLAQEFLPPQLDSAAFSKGFAETSFADGTTGWATFTYSALDKDQPLSRVDVVVDPGADNKIKSIYMEKSFTSGDTLVRQKLLWKAGRNFLIITAQNIPGQSETIRQLKVVWAVGPEGASQ